jgi:hypothetical protein
MIGPLRSLVDAWRGSGRHAVTVPPMDGVLSPNQALEDAPAAVTIAAPDNLVSAGSLVLYSAGAAAFVVRDGLPGSPCDMLEHFDADISALAVAADGGWAAGLENGNIAIRSGIHGARRLAELGGRPIVCPTALSFADPDTLLVATGSRRNPPGQWRRDLMQRNASGSVWRLDLRSGAATCLADGLAWPAGVLSTAGGATVVSEAWRSRLLRLESARRPAEVLADIAGYPGRLAPAADGGWWLAVFAPRSQLVELVLREKDYRTVMMAELDEAHWVAPTLAPARSFLEPMQFGGLRQLGMLKPWAPTRSYGLVVGLDRDFEPRVSFHSRADGRRHGVTSCIEKAGTLFATSRGGNVIVAVPLSQEG